MSETTTARAAAEPAARGRGASRPLLRYLTRRTLQALIVIFIVTIVVFLLLQALPGGPARGVLGQTATQAQIDAFNQAQGFDRPIWEQYLMYLSRLLSGDLGTSYVMNSSVSAAIAERLPKTLLLTGLSLAVALLIAIPLGVYQAAKRNSIIDHSITGTAVVLYSTPAFFLGLILIIVFAHGLDLFPALASRGRTVWDILAEPSALVLPVLTGALPSLAAFSRYARSATLDNLSQDYVRTARSKGTGERKILSRHVLRNSLTPVIAILGYQLPVMFGGALVVEQLYNYPGMGLLFWSAAQNSDFPVLLGCVLVISIATVIGTLLADIFNAVLDPRTRGELR